MSRTNVDLPERSFCGLEFGHNRWFRHLGGCGICKVAWKEYRAKEESSRLSSWKSLCACGCGRVSAYGKRYYRGHYALTDKERRRRRERMVAENPMKADDAKRKISSFWTGRVRPNQSGDQNVSLRPDVRKKISDNNPMRKAEFRERQRAGCLTDVEVRRRSSLIRGENNPSRDSSILARRVDTYTRRLANGEYHLRNNWKTGWYTKSDGSMEWYESSYELAQMLKFDEDGVVWTKRHGIRIPYVSEKGMSTYYVPDFLVDDETIVEVKGWMSELVRLKARAAIEFCRESGKRYLLLLGQDRKIVAELSFLGQVA